MSTMCACGHDMERHNDMPEGGVGGWFGGGCRMCKCETFARVVKGATAFPVKMATCDQHSYIHITGWGCPFCYREAFDKKKREEETHNDAVKKHDLRHLNSQIDSLQRVLGEIYLLSQKDVEGDKWKAYSDERRLYRVHVMARKELYDD